LSPARQARLSSKTKRQGSSRQFLDLASFHIQRLSPGQSGKSYASASCLRCYLPASFLLHSMSPITVLPNLHLGWSARGGSRSYGPPHCYGITGTTKISCAIEMPSPSHHYSSCMPKTRLPVPSISDSDHCKNLSPVNLSPSSFSVEMHTVYIPWISSELTAQCGRTSPHLHCQSVFSDLESLTISFYHHDEPEISSDPWTLSHFPRLAHLSLVKAYMYSHLHQITTLKLDCIHPHRAITILLDCPNLLEVFINVSQS
jgi:hypothetical protein